MVLVLLALAPLNARTTIAASFAAPTQNSAETIKVEADQNKGFSYPYFLFIPAGYRENSSAKQIKTLLVMPNNSGQPNDDHGFHEQNVRTKLFQASFVFGKLNVAILMPVFPRPAKDWKIYTQALDRDSLVTEKKEYKRFDLQLVAMIDHARERFEKENIKLEKRVLIYGYSAAGMFANRFVFLHPDRVSAAAIGSPGGWAIAPVGSYKDRTLPYPIGVGDFIEISTQSFDLRSLRKARLFIFLGDKDENDSVIFRDGYEESDEKLIFELFGKNPLERWKVSEELYQKEKLNAKFKLYHGAGHRVTSEMLGDVISFFSNHEGTAGSAATNDD
jgi:predicted esterase